MPETEDKSYSCPFCGGDLRTGMTSSWCDEHDCRICGWCGFCLTMEPTPELLEEAKTTRMVMESLRERSSRRRFREELKW